MNHYRCFAGLLLACSGLALAEQSPPPAPPMTTEECAVWARERSFAASVEAHDVDAFRAHLHADAVFIDGRGGITRGAAKVAEAWDGIIAGESMVLRWHPDVVSIAGAPAVALSRGPYWIELRKPDAAPVYLIGQFISTWVRGSDGQWQVLFDGGGGNQPKSATAEEVAQLKAGLASSCPRA